MFLKHLLISPWSPPVLPVTRMWPLPWAFMSGRKAWMVWMVPRRLTSMIRLMESRDCTSSGPIKPTPALHTADHEDKTIHEHQLQSFLGVCVWVSWRMTLPRMSIRFSTTLSFASRMDCMLVTSIWSMSNVSLCRPLTLSRRRSFLARFLIVA